MLSLSPLPITQEKTLNMDITRWSILKSDWLYPLQPKWRTSIQSAKTRSGAGCGSDLELIIAKSRLKLKKVGKTPTPFRYDLIQIPYDYTVEVTNRFKGLDLIDSAWTTMNEGLWHCTRGSDQDHHKKKRCKKAKYLRRPYKYLRKEEKQQAKEKR